MSWEGWVNGRIEARRGANLLRHLQPVSPRTGLRVERDGRLVRLFSSNDYLGLSAHPEVARAVSEAALEHGNGPRGSALVCGYTTLHAELERRLAALKQTESALLCPTGFAANLAVLSALGGPGCAIFSDALNHASIIDGARMAKSANAPVHVFRHGDLEHLDVLLGASDAERKLIVTDAVFSMDGDVADLPALVRIKRTHGALLVADDAHATGVFGARGAGLAHAQGVAGDVDVMVGTLSKALGGMGGFVATSDALRAVILNRGRAFIYSTALPTSIVAGVLRGLDVMTRDDTLRDRLWRHTRRVAEALELPATSPILPWVVGGEHRALELSAELLERGVHVTAIRPPTVPEGTARLRVTLSAGHSEEDVEVFLGAVQAVR